MNLFQAIGRLTKHRHEVWQERRSWDRGELPGIHGGVSHRDDRLVELVREARASESKGLPSGEG